MSVRSEYLSKVSSMSLEYMRSPKTVCPFPPWLECDVKSRMRFQFWAIFSRWAESCFPGQTGAAISQSVLGWKDVGIRLLVWRALWSKIGWTFVLHVLLPRAPAPQACAHRGGQWRVVLEALSFGSLVTRNNLVLEVGLALYSLPFVPLHQ